jgi:OPA family glycerol-3-phosphate transporter-like MFS transporter 3
MTSLFPLSVDSESDAQRLIDIENEDDEVFVTEPKSLGLVKALFIPGVIAYSISYACLKSVNYSLFFWLPTYLFEGLHFTEDASDLLPSLYDLGGILGGIVSGYISDRMGCRSPIVIVFLIVSALCLMILRVSTTVLSFSISIALTGFFITGPANIMGSSAAADLGQHPSIEGNGRALATVTGIIDGMGSIGAALAQALIPLISVQFGWQGVFSMLVLFCLASGLFLARICWEETKQFLQRR